MALTDAYKNGLILLFLSCVALWGVSRASSFGLASLNYYFVRNTIELWQTKGEQQTLDDYQKAKAAIEQALIHHPQHPTYVDLLAQIYEWGAIAGFEPQQAALSRAKELYLHAATLRPLWPVTWASLAMIKWRLQEFDEEMLAYLHKANSLGPMKAEVHVLYTSLGLALYRHNSPLFIRLRADIINRIALGLRNPQSRPQVLHLIQTHQADNLVCRWLRHENANTKRLINACR